MTTTVEEIAPGIHRFATYVPDGPPGGLTYNQFLVVDDEPLLFHTGTSRLFLAVHDAVASVIEPESIRWVSSGHASRPDEYGALPKWEAIAPEATVAHGMVGCFVCLSDVATRPPRPLADGEVLKLGDHRLRWIDTPHVPGPWEAGVMFDETTATLFCGDLFARGGETESVTADDIVGEAIGFDQMMHGHAYTPLAGPTLRRLAELEPQRLALMHGPTFVGDGAAQLRELADYLDTCLRAA